MNEDAARMLVDHGKRISALETIEVSGAAGGGSAPDDAQYVVMALNAILTAERVLTAGNSISLADGGAGGNATIALTIPGTLTVATANNAVGPHLHTITSSSNPGAAASILASDANGYLQLVGLGIGAAPGSADLHFGAGTGITHADGIAAGQFLRANGVRYVPDTLDVADITDLAYAAPNLTLGLANAVGAANTVIRTDATILAFDAVVPNVIECDDAAATGAATVAARRDHEHGIVCAVPDRLVPDNAQAEGTAVSFARSDHDHQITCAAPGANLSVSTTNAEGVAANDFARSDHSHAITSSSNPGAAASILASAADGGLQLLRLGIGADPDTNNRITMVDGGQIGQTAGPLLTFDDTLNYLEITGCFVGIGTASPDEVLEVIGPVLSDIDDDAIDGAFYLGNSGHGLRRLDGTNDVEMFTTTGSLYFSGNAPGDNHVAIKATGYMGVGTISPDRLTHAEVSNAVTAAVTYAQRLSHTTSGAAATLFGVGAEHELEDSAGNMQVASEMVTMWARSTSGSELPLLRMTTYPSGSAGPSYCGFWTADIPDDTARIVVPDGAGDCLYRLTCLYVVRASDGGVDSGIADVSNGANVNLYNVGADTLVLIVNANGSVLVERTAGALTYKVGLWLAWL